MTLTIQHPALSTPIEIEKDNTDSLLYHLEHAGIETPGHCRNGICGACRIKLTAGKIHYPHISPLAYLHPKEILPCICVPTTNLTLNSPNKM